MRASENSEGEAIPDEQPPRGITAVGIFLFFGAVMALIAATTLLRPGTILDRLWALNAPAYARLAPLGRVVAIPFLILSTALAVAGTGWFKRRVWGWGLATAIIATQVLGDLANVFMGNLIRGLVGVTIAGALLLYLLRPQVKAAFRTTRSPAGP